MLYNILVVKTEKSNKSAKRGDVIASKESTKSWGKKEGPPRFSLFPFDGTPEEIEYICSQCKYDFNRGVFVDKDTNDQFRKEMVIESSDYNSIAPEVSGIVDIRNVLELNNGEDVDDRCDFLNPFSHIGSDIKDLPYKKQRVYFMKKAYPLRNLPGMDGLFTIIKHGGYGELRECLKNLPTPTKIIIKNVLSSEDYDSLHNNWGVI